MSNFLEFFHIIRLRKEFRSCSMVIRIAKQSAGFDSDQLFAVSNFHIKNFSNKKCIQIMQWPYSDEDLHEIRKYYKNETVALPSPWPLVSCDAIWYCGTIEEAEKREKALQLGGAVRNEPDVPVWPSPTKSLSEMLASVPIVSPRGVEKSSPIAPVSSNIQQPEYIASPVDNQVSQIIEEVYEETIEHVNVVESQTHTGHLNADNVHSESLVNNQILLVPDQNPVNYITQIDGLAKSLTTLTALVEDLKQYCEDKFASLDSKMVNVQKDVDLLKTHSLEKRRLEKNENIVTANEFAQKYQIKIPLESVKEFQDLDKKLVVLVKAGEKLVNNPMYEDLKTHFISCTNSSDEVKTSIDKLFKMIFTGELTWNVTASRKSRISPDKLVLKHTKFFECLRDAYAHVYADKVIIGDETAILKAIGTAVNNPY